METFPAHLKIKAGYTMVELAVVIGVAGVLLTIGLLGYRGFEYTAQLRNTQRELISQLLAARSKALSGVFITGYSSPTHNAVIFTGQSYYVDGIHHRLESVTISSINGSSIGEFGGMGMGLCFFHPSQEPDSAQANCRGTCPTFACDDRGREPGVITITLEHLITGERKCIQIEGSGLRINRIYEFDCP